MVKGLRKMYYVPYNYPYPYYGNVPVYTYGRNQVYWGYPSELEYAEQYRNWQSFYEQRRIELKDYGKEPFVVNIEEASKQNNTYRTAIWTGSHLQVTVMSIDVGGDIGLEVHPDVDQFLRIEDGEGIVQMGDSKDNLTFRKRVSDNDAIMVPAGTWHNITNTGSKPIKLYTIYAPPHHPFGTVQQTKAEAMAEG